MKENTETVLPPEIMPKRRDETVRIPITIESTTAAAATPKEILADPGLPEMTCIHASELAKMRQLGIDVENLGLGTMAQGHLFFSAQSLVMVERKMLVKLNGPEVSLADLKLGAYVLGYIADKKSRLMVAVKSVAQATGKMAGEKGPERPNPRQSFPPQAVIHAAAGATVQVGIAQPKT
jgi:hypothetical protein